MSSFEANSNANDENLALDSEKMLQDMNRFENPEEAKTALDSEELLAQGVNFENPKKKEGENDDDFLEELKELDFHDFLLEDADDMSELEDDIEYVPNDGTQIFDMNEYLRKEQPGAKVERFVVSSELSPTVGEEIMRYEDAEMVVEGHKKTLYEGSKRSTMEEVEDAMAMNLENPNLKIIAVGDGVGGSADGDKAARAFESMIANMRFDVDFSTLSEEEIKGTVAKKLEESKGEIKEGLVTGSFLMFYKDANGEEKGIAVNLGDGVMYRKKANDEFESIAEGFNPWDSFEKSGNIFDAADKWSGVLNGMGFMVGAQYPYLDKYLESISNKPELQSLRDKFDFHTLMDYVEKDQSIEDNVRKKIIKMFKNINRKCEVYYNQEGRVITEGDVNIFDVNKGDKFLVTTDGWGDSIPKKKSNSLMDFNFASPDGRAHFKAGADSLLPRNPKNLEGEEAEKAKEAMGYKKLDDEVAIVIQMK